MTRPTHLLPLSLVCALACADRSPEAGEEESTETSDTASASETSDDAGSEDGADTESSASAGESETETTGDETETTGDEAEGETTDDTGDAGTTDDTETTGDTDDTETTGETDDTETTGDTDDTETTGETEGTETTGPIEPQGSVDVLFVVDNSSSMGEEQGALAPGLDDFVDALVLGGIDFRIAVTTTDNGNPWCAGTTPEGGSFVASSCLGREAAFLNGQGTLSTFDLSCANHCGLDDAAIGLSATTTDVDPDPKIRPWVESIGGQTNLGAGVSVADALRCFLPQGINGCGFESPMESAFKAIVRTSTAGQSELGFLREDAGLVVIFLTDEVDCSYNNSWATIFEQNGNKVFWSDPADAFPTSAVCWNAGTSCTDLGGGTYDCAPGNYDVDGNPLAASDPDLADDAVLWPMARYADQLDAIRDAKQALDPDAEVLVALIGGVSGTGDPTYADVADPEFMDQYGIGPGCSAQVSSIGCITDDDCNAVGGTCSGGACQITQQAVPPVRLLELQDSFGPGLAYSVCTDDYTPALVDIADTIISGG